MALDDIEPFPGQELTPDVLEAIDREERFAPGPTAAPDVRVLLYRPKGSCAGLPLIVDIHGGGFALRADHFPLGAARLALMGATVASIDYRGSDVAPFPAAVEDCFSALCWAVDALDVDRERIAVTGVSAGGALAAAVTQITRDRKGPKIAFQALLIPVIHDACETPSMRQYEEGPVFGGRMARDMWDRYLGDRAQHPVAPPYAAPGRATDLTGLPPAFIQVGGLDPLRDEGINYALALLAADVSVELYCAPRQHHGVSEDPRTAATAGRLYVEAMASALNLSPPE